LSMLLYEMGGAVNREEQALLEAFVVDNEDLERLEALLTKF